MKLLRGKWGLILGGSSGIGLSAVKKLSSEGMNLVVVHRDRRGALPEIEKHFAEVRAHGTQLLAINQDALSADARGAILDRIQSESKAPAIDLMLHSIALGNLKPAAPPVDAPLSSLLDEEDLGQTISNMGTSLLFWVQDLHRRKMLAADARILGLSSEGNSVAWEGYAAVGAAKAALESVTRSIAKEFAPHGVRCNILQAGLTDTKALRLIPGHEALKAKALAKNPFQRLTTPEDVANAIYLMALPEAAWINGALIRVDGGEAISQ